MRFQRSYTRKMMGSGISLAGNFMQGGGMPEPITTISNTNENIISVGFQKEVRSYFGIADALVFPSYREGFPNVVLQAGAMNLPCIVTDINGSNEIISDGINGIIIPPKSNIELYEAMLVLVNDNVFRKKIQNNAREMIVSRFEQKMVWESILKEYKNIEKNV